MIHRLLRRSHSVVRCSLGAMTENLLLSIRLLGGFRVVSGDAVLPVDQPRLQRLLAYLLLHRHHPRPRQQIAFTLWPDTSEEQALKNLRTLLTRLRQTQPEVEPFLESTTYALRWRQAASCHLDVADFEAACAMAASAAQRNDADASITALMAAARLYTGDLLPGWYDDWLVPERERLRQAFLDALEQLALRLEECGGYKEALGHAQQLLRADPLHEAGYRQVMQLQLRLDDRASALRTFHTCATTLRNELGVDPSPATQALYLRILTVDDEPATATQPAAALAAAPRTPATAALVGRQAEWEALKHIWQAAAGRAQLVLIGGEAGIGKTRLAEELLAWVERQGAATAVAHCYASGGSLAYAPVAEWLRSPGLQANVRQLDGIWRSEAARLLPELLADRPDLPPPGPMTEAWQRQRFFQALAHAVLGEAATDASIFGAGTLDAGRRAASVRLAPPRLLLLDDLQWCDRDTLDWLYYLIQANAAVPLLVLATVRVEEVGEEHPLAALRLALARHDVVQEFHLAPLNAAATSALAADLLGQRLAPAEAARLFQETEGNPLFVVETVRAGMAEAQPKRVVEAVRETGAGASASAAALPPKVRAVIRRRLAILSPGAQALAQTAAVIGREFTFAVLARTSGQDEATVVQGLDELWRRQIVREKGVDAYDFSHDKIRAVAYANTGPAQRQISHRLVAEALATLYAGSLDAVSNEIAMHYGKAREPKQAIAFYRRAAAAAQRNYANTEAARIFQRLLADDLRLYHSQTEVCELMLGLGEARRATGHWIEAERIGLEALHIARALDDTDLRVRAQLAVADVIRLQGRFDEAMQWVTSAARAVESGENHRGMMRVLWLMAELCWTSGNGAGALSALARQLEIAAAIGDERGLCEAYDLMGRIHWSHGNWLEAEACCRASLAIAARLSYHFVTIRTAVTLGSVYSSQNKFEESQRWYLQAGLLAQQYGDVENLPWAVANLGHNASERGDFPLALECLEQALRHNLMTGDRFMACVIIYAIGKVAEFTQHADDAEQLYRHAIDVARRLGVHAYLLHMLVWLANFRLDQGRADEVRPLYDEIVEVTSILSIDHLMGLNPRFDVRMLSVRLGYQLGELNRAEALEAIGTLQEQHLLPLQSATLNYELWRINPDDDRVRTIGAATLRSVYAETGLYRLRCQYHAMTGAMLPEPPPLPDVSALIPQITANPDGLMERLAPLLAQLEQS
jgi:DNA-binding SARP family transcriptional activator/predicted ATPase